MIIDDKAAVNLSLRWVRDVVVGLNLCPFAKAVLNKSAVEMRVSNAATEAELLLDLAELLRFMQEGSSIENGPETAILIHPEVLANFDDYNQFLGLAEGLVDQLGLAGELQIASFHPNYQFAGTEANDAENYSNRSPLPMLHVLRESSLSDAIDSYPDTAEIPERNIQLLRRLGSEHMQRILAQCDVDNESADNESADRM